MPTHFAFRSQASACFIGVCSMVLASAFVFVGIELSGPTISSNTAAKNERVNRVGKTDRLPRISAFRNVVKPAMGVLDPNQKLVDGCEALASPLAGSPLAQMAGRCVS